MSSRRTIAAAIAALALTVPAAAQSTPQNAPTRSEPVVAKALIAVPSIAVDATPTSAPRLANAAVGVRVDANTTAPALATMQGNVGRNPAMMIVGGVALIVGAVIGGDSGTIIMIGGGVLGLVGLWQYLQ